MLSKQGGKKKKESALQESFRQALQPQSPSRTAPKHWLLGGKFARAPMSPSLLGSSPRRVLPGDPGAVTRILAAFMEAKATFQAPPVLAGTS